MNHKVWLTVFGVIAALVIGGAGFYAFSGYSKYSDALAGWDDKVRTIESLERKVPYPKKENAEELGKEVKEYDEAVKELYKSLNTFQQPLNVQITGTELQREVSERVQDFRSYASEGGLAIEEPEEFQLGFDLYSNQIPAPDLVPILDYELDAIDRLLRELVAVGGESLSTFERDPIPGEAGGAESHDGGVVHKYPVRMRFRAGYNQFQRLINKLANDKEFFYIVRVLKLKNDQGEGPVKLVAADGISDIPMYVNPATQEVAAYDRLLEAGLGTVTDEELAAALQEDGFVLSKTDARVLMGQEKLNIFMVVDIVRFLSPEEVSAAKEDAKSKSSSRKR